MATGPGTHKIRVITASVRTTNRMNALLNESYQSGKKKSILKSRKDSLELEEKEEDSLRSDIEFYRTNFNMEKVFKLIETIIDERFQWDRACRVYDSWKCIQLAESLSAEIRDKVKQLNYKRHRIVCLVAVIEKRQQGFFYKMAHLVDPKMDNFVTHTYERSSYFIITTVFLVNKD